MFKILNIVNIIYKILTLILWFNFTNYIKSKLNKSVEDRLSLIKNIAEYLEKKNIVYVKIFQSLCINNNIISEKERIFLTKYLDYVPYNSCDIDYKILDDLNSKYNIRLDTLEPLNSGIVSIVFKGIYNIDSNKVVIKVLKKNIKNKLESAFNDIIIVAKILDFIPYFKQFMLKKLLLDNKEILLAQTDFKKEVTNINLFKEKYIGFSEFKIPCVYDHITNDYNNVIIMENIKGLKYSEIDNLSDDIKNEFGKLIIKFGYSSLLHTGAVHCDLHAGNIFFYINNNENGDNLYQIGLIDFGIVTFLSNENKNKYCDFFNNILHEDEYTDDIIINVIEYFLEPKEIFNNLNIIEKKYIVNILKSLFKRDTLIPGLYYLNDIIIKNNMYFTDEFNNVLLSLYNTGNLSKNLCLDITNEYKNILLQFNK